MTSQKSFPSCSRVYCRMCIRKGQPLRGKVPNRKNLRCQCSFQGPVLRQNGETYQMQAKHLWYNVWRHLFLTKQRKNPYEEGCYTGEDVEDVKQKWEAKKHYFEQYKKDGPRPPCIELDTAIQGFNIDNTAAYQAIEDSKALHARRWQTKEGMCRIKRRALPDVRDAPLHDDNAAASCSDGKPRWRSWDGDYAMGYQRHP